MQNAAGRKKRKNQSIISDVSMQSAGMQVGGDCSMVSSDKKGPDLDLIESNDLLNVEEEIK